MDQRNLLLAMALSIGIILGWNVLFPPPTPPQEAEQTVDANGQPVAPSDVALPSAAGPTADAPAAGVPGAAAQSREEAIAQSPRVSIESERLTGSIALKGGRFDDLILSTYKQTLAEDSPPITLLRPTGGPLPYFAEFGWIGAEPGVAPNSAATWTASGDKLAPGTPLTLTWTGETGLVYERTISLDEGYMFTIKDAVRNEGDKAQTLRPYGLVSRAGLPDVTQLFVLHEGFVGVFDEELTEEDYDDLMDDGAKGAVEKTAANGWLGITDVYWLAAIVPEQGTKVKAGFRHHAADRTDRFQADYATEAGVSVAPGETASYTHRFFGGAKEVSLLDAYEEGAGTAPGLQPIPDFHKSIDFGWFHFLTRPFFYALSWLYGLIGNMGLAIMALTVLIKLVFFPLANKSYKSMSQMKALQPEMMALRERYGDDRQKLNQEMMTLYKEKKVNPAAGCLPILIQIPVFFALYKVLLVTIEMRHAPFFGWIQDLSAPDPTNVFNLFGLLPFDPPSFLHLGAWALAMGTTMWFQQRLNPEPTDPVQARIFMLMPIVFTFLLAGFAAGLVIYWTWNNLLSITQQAIIMKRQGVPIGRRAQKRAAEAASKSS